MDNAIPSYNDLIDDNIYYDWQHKCDKDKIGKLKKKLKQLKNEIEET